MKIISKALCFMLLGTLLASPLIALADSEESLRTVPDLSNEMSVTDVFSATPAISSYGFHLVGLQSDGTVVATGWNDAGQCEVGDWYGITAISAGLGHTVGLKSDGSVVAVGDNEGGQVDLDNWSDIVAISAGGLHTVGLKSDGTVIAAGLNDAGQCDVGDWLNIIAISTGDWHTIGLKSDGTVIAVGLNDSGQLDVESWNDIIAISTHAYHTIGLKSDGTVVAAGLNDAGQCDVGSWQNIIDISAGLFHTVGLRADGTVIAAGTNEIGECDVDQWNDITAITAGWATTFALTSDGTVLEAGMIDYNFYDADSWQLMIPLHERSTAPTPTPTPIPSPAPAPLPNQTPRPMSNIEQRRQANRRSFIIWIGIVVTAGLVVPLVVKASRSNKRQKLIESATNSAFSETQKPTTIDPATKVLICANCKTPVGESDRFCKSCGTTMVQRKKKTFSSGYGGDNEFAAKINQWLWENRQIGNISCKFYYDNSFGFFVNKYHLNNVVLEYEEMQSDNENVYAIDIVSSTRIIVSGDTDEMLGKWKIQHPDAVVINVSGGTHTRGDPLGAAIGFGLNNVSRSQLYIFYKMKRNT